MRQSYQSQRSQAFDALLPLHYIPRLKRSILACLNNPKDTSKKPAMDHLEAAASSMLPPPQRDETVRHSQEEWNRHRPIIEGMYPLKGMSLKAIISFLKEDRGLVIK